VSDSGSSSSGVVDYCSVVRRRECSVEDSDLLNVVTNFTKVH
jgi:hypothetical protein